MSDELKVEARVTLGSRASRKLRDKGMIPAILYGHGEDNVALSVPRAGLDRVLRHGGHVVRLQGAASGDALIKAVQLDALGSYVVHLDLYRVLAGEKIDVAVAIELKGDSPGVGHGGMLEVIHHEIQLSCPAQAVPDSLVVNIGSLDVGGAITAGDVTLPEGVVLAMPAETMLVHCIKPHAGAEEAAGGAEGAEPAAGA